MEDRAETTGPDKIEDADSDDDNITLQQLARKSFRKRKIPVLKKEAFSVDEEHGLEEPTKDLVPPVQESSRSEEDLRANGAKELSENQASDDVAVESRARKRARRQESQSICKPESMQKAQPERKKISSVRGKKSSETKKHLDSERTLRKTRKRRQEDMTYEGDMDWDILVGDADLSRDANGGSEKDRPLKGKYNGEAAVAVGLKVRTLITAEKVRFKDVLKRRGGLQEYLECRNMILGLWEKDVKHLLELTDCGVSCSPHPNEPPRLTLIRELHEFLECHGYINIGIVKEKKVHNPNVKVESDSSGIVDQHMDKVIQHRSKTSTMISKKPYEANGQKNLAAADENAAEEAALILGQIRDSEDASLENSPTMEDAKDLNGSDMNACNSEEEKIKDNENTFLGHGATEVIPVDMDIISNREDHVVEEAKTLKAKTASAISPVGQDTKTEETGSERQLDEINGAEVLHNFHKYELKSNSMASSPADGAHGRKAEDQARNRKKVIVIGAGPAGLMAARHMQRMKFSVTVLEARNRVGGRVCTDRSTFSVPVDMGASIITGVEADVATERRADPSALFCRQLGLELTTLRGDCPLYDSVTGCRVPDDLDEALEAEYNGLLDNTLYLVAQNGDAAMRMSLEQGLEQALERRRSNLVRKMGRTSVLTSPNKVSIIERCENDESIQNEFGESGVDGKERSDSLEDDDQQLNPLERRIMDWHFANLEYGCAAPLSHVSLPYWNQDDIYGGFGGAHCMIKGGYSTVMEALAEGLDIRLGHVVSEIVYGLQEGKAKGRMLKVRTNEGEEFIGDAVLVTIPLGCLKAQTINFIPSLPEWKLASIQRLGFGILNKVVLEFSTVFWDESVDYFGAAAESTDFRGQCFMFWNLKRTVGAPVLIALVAGNAAIEGEKQEKPNLVAHALKVLRKLYGDEAVPDPKASDVTKWGSDVYSRGSYSYVAVGASGEDYDILGRPVDNCLFFAGEGTCKEHPDTVGGALMSGLREAVRIVDILENRGDLTAEVEIMSAIQQQSDSERNEVRDMMKRISSAETAADLSNNNREMNGTWDGNEQAFSKTDVLKDMFANAKTTAGRLLLAKEMLQLPVKEVRSFAGTKAGLLVLNSWILDSMGKDGTQLLRHCVRLLLAVATDLLSIRQSGVGKTIKEKVCVHTSRDIRAIADQLVKMWIEVFRREKLVHGSVKSARRANVNSGLASNIQKHHRGLSISQDNSVSNLKGDTPSQQEITDEASEQRPDTVSGSESQLHEPEISEIEAAALAEAEAARAAAIAAAKAYEVSYSSLPDLPKIVSFHKFAKREKDINNDFRKKRPEQTQGASSISIVKPLSSIGSGKTLSSVSIGFKKVSNWSLDLTGSCSNVNSPGRLHLDMMGGCTYLAQDTLPSTVDDGNTGFNASLEHLAMKEEDSPFLTQDAIAEPETTEELGVSTGPGSNCQTATVVIPRLDLESSKVSDLTQKSGHQDKSASESSSYEQIKKAVSDYVAHLLAPLYKTKRLEKDGYKTIVKKATAKVLERDGVKDITVEVSEFLNCKRKNKIRALVDKLVEKHLACTIASQ